MATTDKEVRYDISGYEAVTEAIRELINTYPGLESGEEIKFSVLSENEGKAMFPVSGGVIVEENESITGHVTQICQYPFFVTYRASGLSENNKASVKEWLDTFGKWLEKQPVIINSTTYNITDYPALTGNRKFVKIERTSPAYLDTISENKAETWVMQLSAKYQTEFER